MTMAEWQNDKMTVTKWQHDKMTSFEVTKWQILKWQNDIVKKWQNIFKKMTKWQNDKNQHRIHYYNIASIIPCSHIYSKPQTSKTLTLQK